MRILIFHGYLLRGTGSNVYNANLAQALAGLGHEVHLLCQDRDAGELPWVDAVGRWVDGDLRVEPSARPGGSGVTAYLPEIGGLLPVYVEDSYEGFRVKTFADLTDAELDAYIDANVVAVRDVDERIGGAEAALANHLVMGPLICARAGIGFAAKVHGSALSYTVRPNPRFLPHAREGIGAARAVLVGSRHTAESLWETIADDALPRRTRLGPPGVDVAGFRPRDRDEAAREGVGALAASLETQLGDGPGAFGRDPALAAPAVAAYAGADGPRVIFVGKLIVSKGCDLLLAAWPLIHATAPGGRLLMVGFGEYRDGLLQLWERLGAGDLEGAREIAARGRALEGGEEGRLRFLDDFLADPPTGYVEAARAAAGSVDFAGRLEHDEIVPLLQASDAMVVPSTFPEAFGMVAAEAAATGALPVCARHSGLAEVASALDEELPEPSRGLTSFPLDEGAVGAIAERVRAWLELREDDRAAAEERLADTVRRLWSWEGVARGVIAASAGRLDELAPIPGDP